MEVATPQEALRLGMHGSPTVLIDGRDPFPTDVEQGSLSCRLYLSADAITGASSVAELIKVIAPGPQHGDIVGKA